MSSKRRKRRGAVQDEIEHEESTSTHILSSGPIMIKETETETEERDEGGMTYGQLNMLTVVLSERREGCPQIPNSKFPTSQLYSYRWKRGWRRQSGLPFLYQNKLRSTSRLLKG